MPAERSGLGAALFARPSHETLSVEREAVDATCPACAGTTVERYRVLQVTGWKLLTRCQTCLEVLGSEDAPTPFGFTYLPYGSYLRRQAGEEKGGDR
jgi:hypothetical protein